MIASSEERVASLIAYVEGELRAKRDQMQGLLARIREKRNQIEWQAAHSARAILEPEIQKLEEQVVAVQLEFARLRGEIAQLAAIRARLS